MTANASVLCPRRGVLAGIAATFSLSLFSRARSTESEPALAADEGIVLYRVASIFATRAAFRQLHSTIQFIGLAKTADEPPVPTVAKAGFYYFFNYDTNYNIAYAPFREPEDARGAFRIEPGVVTYVGDWGINLQSVITRTSVDTIVRAREANPWLEHYPLHVSIIGRDTVRLPWEQVPES